MPSMIPMPYDGGGRSNDESDDSSGDQMDRPGNPGHIPGLTLMDDSDDSTETIPGVTLRDDEADDDDPYSDYSLGYDEPSGAYDVAPDAPILPLAAGSIDHPSDPGPTWQVVPTMGIGPGLSGLSRHGPHDYTFSLSWPSKQGGLTGGVQFSYGDSGVTGGIQFGVDGPFGIVGESVGVEVNLTHPLESGLIVQAKAFNLGAQEKVSIKDCLEYLKIVEADIYRLYSVPTY